MSRRSCTYQLFPAVTKSFGSFATVALLAFITPQFCNALKAFINGLVSTEPGALKVPAKAASESLIGAVTGPPDNCSSAASVAKSAGVAAEATFGRPTTLGA